MLKRPRRLRKTPAIRALVQEVHVTPQDLVPACFLIEGENRREPVTNMPGVFRLSCDELLRDAERFHKAGVSAIALFPALSQEKKDDAGSAAFREDALVPTALRRLKNEIPSLCLIADVALDPFTSHGHDGLLDASGDVMNDATVERLAALSCLYAASGADFIAPSDMMDGRVRAIRTALDQRDFFSCGIISYATKYASHLYAPYRDVLGSTLKGGDKRSYQMDPANRREAVREALLDEEEGADVLLVKPALFYLDIIHRLKETTHLPIAAFQVSGEYALIASSANFLNAREVMKEAHLAMKRAGADFIFTYAAEQLLETCR